MLVLDYILVAIVCAGFLALMAFSERARIIVKQSLLHPSGCGYMVIDEGEVAYFPGEPPLTADPDAVPEPDTGRKARTARWPSRREAENLGDAGRR
jgi:hypothetical protein